MKKDVLSYELGVLMAIGYNFCDDGLRDSVATILKSLEDDEISDDFIISGIENELIDSSLRKEKNNNIKDKIYGILEEYELDIDCFKMTIEDEERVNEFFKKDELFLKVADDYDRNDINPSEVLLFEDFKLAKNIANEYRNLHIYTLVNGDRGTAWIIDGWHVADRQGYFFTTERIDIPEEGLRYW